jgi:hypothetical protein
MSKVSSYKKLYYVGFTFLFLFVLIIIYTLSIVFNQYSLKQKDTSNTVVDTLSNQTDTIFQEKIVEILKVDTLKVYIPVKPKVETKDTTTSPSLPVSSQSQN